MNTDADERPKIRKESSNWKSRLMSIGGSSMGRHVESVGTLTEVRQPSRGNAQPLPFPGLFGRFMKDSPAARVAGISGPDVAKPEMKNDKVGPRCVPIRTSGWLRSSVSCLETLQDSDEISCGCGPRRAETSRREGFRSAACSLTLITSD